MRSSTSSPNSATKSSSMSSCIIVPPLPWASRMRSGRMVGPPSCRRVGGRLGALRPCRSRCSGSRPRTSPRDETMHGPIGCSGVHALAEELALEGERDAAQHVAALAALDLARLGRRARHAHAGVVLRELGRGAPGPCPGSRRCRAIRRRPARRPPRSRATRRRVALGVHAAPVGDLHLGAALGELLRRASTRPAARRWARSR